MAKDTKKVKKVKKSKGMKVKSSSIKKPKKKNVGESTGSLSFVDDNWLGRKAGMQCRTCISYRKKKDLEDSRCSIGRCRRHAPTMTGFPVVFGTDSCGDHKIDEDKI